MHAYTHTHMHDRTYTHTVNAILLTTKFYKCKRAGATGTGAFKQYINQLSFSEKLKVSVNSYGHWKYLIFRTLVQRKNSQVTVHIMPAENDIRICLIKKCM